MNGSSKNVRSYSDVVFVAVEVIVLFVASRSIVIVIVSWIVIVFQGSTKKSYEYRVGNMK